MASTLKPEDLNITAIKRARSAEQSKTSTPTIEKSFDFEYGLLPPFLRLSNDEIKARFETVDARQAIRLGHQRYSNDPDSPWTQTESVSHSARARNRYYDIRPWDKARVKLKVPEGSSDYINASPIVLECSKTGQKRKYIATQGPKEASVPHFWQMVWHETGDVAVIIMLTQFQEGVRDKCFQYFPEHPTSPKFEFEVIDDDGEEQPALLSCTESKTDDSSNTTMRTLEIESQGKSKIVHHLFFQGWPDFGVPGHSDRYALISLIKLSRELNAGWDNPRVVHCSAGVGRTGSFIALEHLLAELEAGTIEDQDSTDEDPIFDTVDSLREQRMTMVQSEVQYQLLYELLRDATHAKLKERAIAEKMKSMTTGQSLPSTGEPVHKAMRFTRKMRGVWSGLRERSSSRKGENRKKSDLSNETRFKVPGTKFAPSGSAIKDDNDSIDQAIDQEAWEEPRSRPDSKSEPSENEEPQEVEADGTEEVESASSKDGDETEASEAVATSDSFHDARESPCSPDPAAESPAVPISVKDEMQSDHDAPDDSHSESSNSKESSAEGSASGSQ